MKDKKFEAFKKWATKKLGEDIDKYDLEAEYDDKLTLQENKSQFATKYLKDKLGRQETEAENDRYINYIEELIEKNKQKRVFPTSLKGFYKPIFFCIKNLTNAGNRINLIFIRGRGGIGKSYGIRSALEENGIEYEPIGTVTEATLPEILHKFSDKTLWFKDVVKIFNNPNAIDLIKSATETDLIEGGRLICVHKYSHELKKAGVPRKFIFTGNIIFDYNKLENTKYEEDFNALKSRGIFIDLVFDFDQMCSIMKLIAQENGQQMTPDEKKMVTNFLIQNYNFCGNNFFNLRTQAKAFNTYRCCREDKLNWQQEILEELQNSRTEVQDWLYQFIGEGIIHRKELVKVLMRTGVCRAERTAYQKIKQWEYAEEIFELAHGVYALKQDMGLVSKAKPEDLEERPIEVKVRQNKKSTR